LPTGEALVAAVVQAGGWLGGIAIDEAVVERGDDRTVPP